MFFQTSIGKMHIPCGSGCGVFPFSVDSPFGFPPPPSAAASAGSQHVLCSTSRSTRGRCRCERDLRDIFGVWAARLLQLILGIGMCALADGSGIRGDITSLRSLHFLLHFHLMAPKAGLGLRSRSRTGGRTLQVLVHHSRISTVHNGKSETLAFDA